MARQLQALGFDATALTGGYTAWQALYPVEPKEQQDAVLARSAA